MADWKVAIEEVCLFDHPNADQMELVRLGYRQFCVKKGLYKQGQRVVSIPEKSCLPEPIAKPYIDYLSGNKVKSVKLRGELSEGIIYPLDLALDYIHKHHIEEICSFLKEEPQGTLLGKDISRLLDIVEFTPEIPKQLAGDMKALSLPFLKHDCNPYGVQADLFNDDDTVVVTEKIHGSQANYLFGINNGQIVDIQVTSKGIAKRGAGLKAKKGDEILNPLLIENAIEVDNTYWKALYNSNLIERVKEGIKILKVEDGYIHLTGEVIPVQKGYNYGYDTNRPVVKLFRVVLNGQIIPFNYVPNCFTEIYVPKLYSGDYWKIKDSLYTLAKGKSTLTDSHIKEGIVVTFDRAKVDIRGNLIVAKIINPKYLGSDDDFN